MEQVIKISELDKNFKYQILKEPGGEGLLKCFACGTCTASCPVREVDEKFNPRKIIRMAILGMKKEVLENEFIWLCAGCYICQERCPQDVRITDLMGALRNIAVKEGFIHPSFVAQIDFLHKFGRLYEVTEFDNKKRVKNGLPEIKHMPEEIQKIFEETGVAKFVEGEQ